MTTTIEHPAPAALPSVTRLPEATREEMLGRWLPSALESDLRARGRAAAAPDEPAWRDPFLPLGPNDDAPLLPEAVASSTPDDRENVGAYIALVREGKERTGLTAHRGVLHPDEWVNEKHLRAMAARQLGFTLAEIDSVYERGPGPTPRHLRALQARIDARLLEVKEAGGNVTRLGWALGWGLRRRSDGTTDCDRMERVLTRARKAFPAYSAGAHPNC